MPLVMGGGMLPRNVPKASQSSCRRQGQTTMAESGMA
jgi:hypothetical protein